MKILIIDDSKWVADLIADYLQSQGHKVSIAYTGSEGLQILQQDQQYETVICDYDMPGMKGTEVVQTIRKTSNINIIAASSLYDYGKQMMDAGATSIFLKMPPLNWDLLKVLL